MCSVADKKMKVYMQLYRHKVSITAKMMVTLLI